MYRINYTGRPTLTTPDEVLQHSTADSNFDARTLINNIIPAEERFIAQALGNAFYEELLSQKNRTVTAGNKLYLVDVINAANPDNPISANVLIPGMVINAAEFITNVWYRRLWEMYLIKLCAEVVDYTCIVPSWLRATSAGQMLNNPKTITGNEGAASGDRKDVEFKMDHYLQDRIDPMTERMKLFIFQNKAWYPTFPFPDERCNAHNEPDGISISRKSGWVFGVYDDDQEDHIAAKKVTLKPTLLTLANPGQHYLSQLPVKLNISSTSPEIVQVFSGNTAIAEVHYQSGDWYITMKATGTATIYVSQAAGSGYAAAEATGTITIIPDNTNAFNYTL